MRCWNWAAARRHVPLTPRRSLGGLDIGPLDRLMGYPTCAILRTDLQAVLLRRARGGRAGGVRPRGHGHRNDRMAGPSCTRTAGA